MQLKKYTRTVKKKDLQLIENIRIIEGRDILKGDIYKFEGKYIYSWKFVLKEPDIYKIGWSKVVWFHALRVKIHRSFFSSINKFQAGTNAERCIDMEPQLRKTIFEPNRSMLLGPARAELKTTVKNFF